MTTWSLDYDEFAALCEQLLGKAGARPTPLRDRPAYRGLWFHYAAGIRPGTARHVGLRRGHGFPRGTR